jgi:ubiquinone/menaquinone biosynthesis C-methylase UbiE
MADTNESSISNYERLGYSFSKRSWARSDELAKQVQALADELDGQNWLDVGCGPGDLTTLLYRPGRNIIGFDLSAKMILDNRTRLLPTTLVQGDVHNCPFRSNIFDVAACRNVLKHCRNIQLAISEMTRVCRPFGHLLIVESCASSEEDRRFMDSVISVSEPTQHGFLTPSEWEWIVTNSGTRLVARTNFTHQVVSTPEYRAEQYGMNEAKLARHWKIFSSAPSRIRERKEIQQSVDGELRFRLSWVAILAQVLKVTNSTTRS